MGPHKFIPPSAHSHNKHGHSAFLSLAMPALFPSKCNRPLAPCGFLHDPGRARCTRAWTPGGGQPKGASPGIHSRSLRNSHRYPTALASLPARTQTPPSRKNEKWNSHPMLPPLAGVPGGGRGMAHVATMPLCRMPCRRTSGQLRSEAFPIKPRACEADITKHHRGVWQRRWAGAIKHNGPCASNA